MTIDYQKILEGKYPAKAHAKRVAEYVRSKVPNVSGILYVEARKEKLLEDCDQEEHFRQRRSFYFLTGCPLADCHYIYDLDSGKSTLFIPGINPDSVIWSGLPVSIEEALEKWDVDDVKEVSEVNPSLASLGSCGGKDSRTVFAIANQVSDDVTFLGFETNDFSVLKEAINDCRAVKDEYETALIAKANEISGEAHRAVAERVRHVKNETELEAVFLANCIAAGAKNQAYHPIVAAGRAGATLHYLSNNADMQGKHNLLLDAGAEWNCYAADITRTLPITGKFTKESRAIYDIVLRMQLRSIDMLKEGVIWDDVHILAHKVLIEGLLSLGILRGDKDEIFGARTSVAFMPHGLGHYLGMDTHDTGGNPNYADEDKMFRYLRKRGPLPAGSVVTVEPGCYFCNFIIEPYLKDEKHAKYIDKSVLDQYWDVGGVRIEDNILITSSGYENLTPATAVKDPDELEKMISAS